MRSYFSGLILVPLLSGCSVFGINSVEEAGYDVLRVDDKFELRVYQPMVVAETYVEGDFDAAGALAFQKLFGYISKENKSTSKIAMTAPVMANQAGSEPGTNIDMVTSLLEEREGQGWRYMFVLPAEYSLRTAPAPLDESVKISTIPQKKVAVLRFSGLRDEQVIIEKTLLLEQWIVANDLTANSRPRWAGFNPPWTLPFLRRNEVMIDVN